MAGKAYTMREMKAMVEYLTEHKAYSEIRGRKMWMEFANSGKTTRTWQSLKETFIKRILPDLHNPYYRLTLDQVRSFREGKDVAEKEKRNRLEYVTASEDSVAGEIRNNVRSPNEGTSQIATTSKEAAIINLEEELKRVTGEDTAAKINTRNRSSADTVIIETYDNTELLQQTLGSPLRKESDAKPLKDLLIFEPMTPLVKELLEDFETEPEDNNEEEESALNAKEAQKTTESEQVLCNESDHQNTAEIIEEINHITEGKVNSGEIPISEGNNVQDKSQIVKPQSEKNNNSNESDKQTANDGNNVITIHDSDEYVTANSKTMDSTIIPPNQTKRTSNHTQISGNTTSDTILPNNQECLNISKKATQNETNSGQDKDMKKRASSNERNIKKQKLCNEQPVIGIDDTSEEIPIIEINSEIPDIGATVEIDIDPKLASDNSVDAPPKDDLKNLEKTATDDSETNVDPHKNPCLQSVSLFEEQFKTTQYSSDSDDKSAAPKDNQEVKKPEEVVVENPQKEVAKAPQKEVEASQNTFAKSQQQMIKSPQKIISSQKENKEEQSPTKTPELLKQVNDTRKITRQSKDNRASKGLLIQRDKVLANVFGFTNGGTSTSRKSRGGHKRHQHRHRTNTESNSSDWMSESDSDEYVSAPRPSRQKRKYLKPKPSRILEDPEEGMLYVIFGKNIYPLVKNGKHVKNFVTYKHDSESDLEDESYWKKKYIQEKKKLEEFKTLISDKEPADSNDRASPILPTTSKKSTSNKVEDKITNEKEKTSVENKNESKDDKLVLKFATGHGEELRLEGGWTQISSAIPQMMQMLRNNPNTKAQENLSIKIHPERRQSVTEMELSSGKSTPTIITTHVDPEVHEKVNQLETEIFREIEEREKEELLKQNEAQLTVNVAKRRGRPRKTPSPSSATVTPSKKAKTPNDGKDSSQEATKETKPVRKKTVTETKNTSSPKQDATPKEILPKKQRGDTTDPSKSQKPTSTQNNVDKSGQKESQSTVTSDKSTKTSKQSTKTSKLNIATSKLSAQTSKSAETSKAIENNETNNEIEPKRRTSLRLSKQSDIEIREKNGSLERLTPTRRIRTPRKYDTDSSASDVVTRTRRTATKDKAKGTPNIDFEDDNVRFMFPPSPPKNKVTPRAQKKKSPKINKHASLNSVDNTQGYQDSDISPLKLYKPRRRRVSWTAHKRQYRQSKRRRSYPTLVQDLITSDSNNSSYFVPVRRTNSTTNSAIYRTDSYQLLMPKPKAVSKLDAIDENNTRHFGSVSKECSEQSSELNVLVEIGSSSNVSLPLSPELSIVEKMSVSREVLNNSRRIEPLSVENSDKLDQNEYVFSELDASVPLMNQQCQPKMNSSKNTLTDTFMTKVSTVNLREDLTLSETLDQRLRNLLLESTKKPKENAMDVNLPNVHVKKRTKKRCSTPRKKNTRKKAKGPKDVIIEEEHMETCSLGSRKSCPPVITFIRDENANDCASVKPKNNTKTKKDIIKVKIQRPKEKKLKEPKILRISLQNITPKSSCTDSGINDAEFSGIIRESEDSVDLIHNHSETCLLANECIDNSVEIVENSKSSAISVNSSQSLDSDIRRLLEDTSHVSEELFGTAAENFNTGPKSESPKSIYQSPMTNSLLTDDLSDEVTNRPSWCLLSDDENTQTNINFMAACSNLNKLFPIACAVPDLSTISEMSKENDDSRKPRSDIIIDNDMDTFDMLNMF